MPLCTSSQSIAPLVLTAIFFICATSILIVHAIHNETINPQDYTMLFYTFLGLSLLIPIVWFVFARWRPRPSKDSQDGDAEKNLAEPIPRTGFASTLAKLGPLLDEQATDCPQVPKPDPEVPLSAPTIALRNSTTTTTSSLRKTAHSYKTQHISYTVPEVTPGLSEAINTWLMTIDTTVCAMSLPGDELNNVITSTTPVADVSSQNQGMLGSPRPDPPLYPVLPPHIHIQRSKVPGPNPPPAPAHPTKTVSPLPSKYHVPSKSTFSNTTSSVHLSFAPPSITPSAAVTSVPIIPKSTPPSPKAKAKAPFSPCYTRPSLPSRNLSYWFLTPYLSTPWLDYMPPPSHSYWKQRVYHQHPDLLPTTPRFANDGIEHIPQWHQTEGWECSDEAVRRVIAVKKRQEERAEGRRKRQMMGRWERVWSVLGAGIGGREEDWEEDFGVEKHRRPRDMLIMRREATKNAGWECYHRF